MLTAEAVLKGRRLVLRPFTVDDAAALFEACLASHEALHRRLNWASAEPTLQAEADFIAACGAAAKAGTALALGIFEAKGGAAVGVISLKEVAPAEREHARFAVWVRAGRMDRGYATEAGRLVLLYGFKKLKLRRLSARLDPTNRAFRRVLKRLGFRFEGCLRADKRINGRWIDQECWGILRGDRPPSKPVGRKT